MKVIHCENSNQYKLANKHKRGLPVQIKDYIKSILEEDDDITPKQILAKITSKLLVNNTSYSIGQKMLKQVIYFGFCYL